MKEEGKNATIPLVISEGYIMNHKGDLCNGGPTKRNWYLKMLPAHLKTVGKFIWLAARNHWVEHAFCHLLDKTSKTRSGTWLNGISLAGPSCVKGMKDSICSHIIESKYCRKMKWVWNWLVHLFFHTCNSYPCCLNKTAPSALLNCRLWAPNANEKGFLPFAKRCVDDTTRTQRWIYGCS